MNYLDAILIIPLLWAVYKGFTKGFIIQLAALAALVLGVWGAIRFSDLTAEYLTQSLNFENQHLALISFAVTFIIIVIVVHILARLLHHLVKAVALGIFNRLFGVAFAVFKFAFIISVMLVILNFINKGFGILPEEDKEESILYDPIANIAPSIFPYLKFDKYRLFDVPDHEDPEELEDYLK